MPALTVTARKHLVKALVGALRIFPYQAEEILERLVNRTELEHLASPLHGTQVLICENNGTRQPAAHLYRNAFNKGFEPIGILHLKPDDLSSWLWYYQDEAREIARQIASDLRRHPEQAARTDTESWLNATIIGYQDNDGTVEFDLEIPGQSGLALGLYDCDSEHFENKPGARRRYFGNLLGSKVDLLVAPVRDTEDRFDYRIIGVIPGGIKASENDALSATVSDANWMTEEEKAGFLR